MKKETYTKYQLECKLREIKDLHKAEIEQLENDNKHLKGAVTSLSERLDAVTKERDAMSGSNKKLADQFYEYREELVKWKAEAGNWHNKYDGKSYELEGVRGALKRESEMRIEAKKKCDELCENLVKMGNEFEAYRKSFNDKDIECSELRDKAWKWDKIQELVNAHGIDTMSKLKDALVELEHKREDVESLKTSLADSCAAKIKEGRDLTAKIESLERELCSVKEAMARDAEEAHKLRGWYDNLKKLYDKARKEGEEGCAMWREDAWKARDDRDFYKKKAENLEHAADDYRKKCVEIEKIQRKHNMLTLESLDNALKQWNYVDGKLSHDLCMPLESLIQLLDEYKVNDFCKLRERLMYGPTDDYSNALANVRNLEKENKDLKAVADDQAKQIKSLVNKRDELQDRVNILEQRWTDKFNPEDELFGRKISEWQEYDAVLVKYGVPSPKSLDAKLDPFDPDRQESVRAYNVMKNHKINSASGLDVELTSWGRIREVLHKHGIHYLNDLDKLLGIAVNIDLANGLGSKWRDVVDKHHVANDCDLDCRLTMLEKYQSAAYDLQKSDGFKWLSETVSGRRK